MSKGEQKRQFIFDKYVKNRNLLIDNNLIQGNRDFYLCPLCNKEHASINEEDPLSLEDAPPKSLGGKARTLTCKSCNNESGRHIDYHLTEKLREIDSAKFLPNTETKVKIKIGDQVLNGTVKIDDNGKMSMFHSNKNNHPIKLEEKMVGLKNGDLVDLNFLRSRVIPEKFEYALLKTGYMLAFEKLGSSLIFHKCFDIVRTQIKNPEKRIYPENFWISPPYPKEMEGVYFICDKGLESIFVLFNLSTGNTIRKFGTFLPCPANEFKLVLNRLNEKLEIEKSFDLQMYPYEQDNEMYLENIEEIKQLHSWMEKRAKNETG